jgi:hypothetical protein
MGVTGALDIAARDVRYIIKRSESKSSFFGFTALLSVVKKRREPDK